MKARPTLLPPVALALAATLMAEQDDEHDGGRWQRHDVEHHLDAAWRHLLAHQAGQLLDLDSQRPHLEHFAVRALMALDVYARTSDPPGMELSPLRGSTESVEPLAPPPCAPGCPRARSAGGTPTP